MSESQVLKMYAKERNAGNGAEWIKRNLQCEMSTLGTSVANLLDDVFVGIYHLSPKALRKIKWDDSYCIRFVYFGDLATVGFNRLTKLVVRAHDRMLRVSLRGIGPNYMEMLFHQRTRRNDGYASEICPTIEQHIKHLRSYFQWEENKEKL